MSAADILRRARARIADPSRWTQRAFARDALGREAISSPACSWCALGALFAETAEGASFGFRGAMRALLAEAARELGFGGVASLNDSTDHATVLRMFDLAIANAEASS